MKKFLYKNTMFIAIFLGVAIGAFSVLSALVKTKADFTIGEDTRCIMLGHSHAECAYNDELIDDFENFAISGESYFYTYPKVKKLVEQNPQIKTVFIEFTNNQLAKDVEKWIWTEKYLSYYYAIYSPFISLKDKIIPASNNPKGFITNLPITFKDLGKKLRSSNINYSYEYGGYNEVEGTLEEYIAMKDTMQDEDFVEIETSLSEVQVEYLEKILNFLGEKGIEVILIRSPQHKDYTGFINESFYQEILQSKLQSYTHIDLVNFPISNTEFRDYEHLNKVGAEKVSSWLNEVMKDSTITIKGHLNYNQINKIRK